MANLTFKSDLLPNSNLEYNLGSSTMQWKINGVANPQLTDTTYNSLAAVAGGTDLSLVTTGEKYTWNNNSGLPAVTSDDNGKFLIVVNGAWAVDTIANANGASF